MIQINTEKPRVFKNTAPPNQAELILNKPIPILGEPQNFLLRLTTLDGSPVFFQTPQTKLKPGFSKLGKSRAADYIFEDDQPAIVFMSIMEKLESFSQKILVEKQEEWFDTRLTAEDIDNLFISPIKIVRTGKTFTLRTTVNLDKLKIYDISRKEVEYDEEFKTDHAVVALVEILGVKCTPRNFQIEVETKQIMTLGASPLSECLIGPAEEAAAEEAPTEKPLHEPLAAVMSPPPPVEPQDTEEMEEVLSLGGDDNAPPIILRDEKAIYAEIIDEVSEKARQAMNLAIQKYKLQRGIRENNIKWV